MIPTSNNLVFIVAAYAAAWVMMIGYSVHLFRAVARARRAYATAAIAAASKQ